MVHESIRGTDPPPSGRTLCASLSTLTRVRLSIRVPDWTRYRDVAPNDIQRLKNDQHYVLVTPFTNTLLVVGISISALSFLSFFILIVLLMVLLRDYIRLKWQSKLYEYGVRTL